MAISPQRIYGHYIYLYSTHRAVIFVIAHFLVQCTVDGGSPIKFGS